MRAPFSQPDHFKTGGYGPEMGVDLCVWRARIGLFNLSTGRPCVKRTKVVCAGTCGSVPLVLSLVMILLIMAGVEQNPGPGKMNGGEKKDKTPPPAASPDTETVYDVFCRHSYQLVTGITQPNLMAVRLFSKGLISAAVKNRVTTVTGADNTDRAIMLVNEVEARLKVDPRPEQVMRELCEVMETETALQPVARSIQAALGLGSSDNTTVAFTPSSSQPVPLPPPIPSPIVAHPSSLHPPPPPVSCQPVARTALGTDCQPSDQHVAAASSDTTAVATIFTFPTPSSPQPHHLSSPPLPPSTETYPAAHHSSLHHSTRSVEASPSRLQQFFCNLKGLFQRRIRARAHVPESFQLFIDHLKACYRNSKFPTYFKEPSLRVRPKKFIHLSLVSNEDTEEEGGTSFLNLRLHGNIQEMKKKRKAMEMENVGKTEDGSVPHRILVEGAPGIGKTTFAWELCRQWEQGQMLRDWEVVVLLQLRIREVRKATTLRDLLFQPNPRVREEVLDYITSTNGRGVMFIFEGYDELSEEHKTEDSIFQQLLNGWYLSEATIMITSRPVASSGLSPEFRDRVDQHVEIIGFTEEDIDSYIKSVCQDKPNILPDLKLYLSSNPFVYSAVCVPLQCALVTALYIENWRKKGKSFAPSTLTELYTALIECLLLRFIDDHPEHKGLEVRITEMSDSHLSQHPVWKLAKLAAEGLRKRQYIFEDVECQTMDLMQTAEDTLVYRQQRSVSYCFLHLTLQEFLAALYWSRQGSEELVSVVTRSGLFPLETLVKEGVQEESGYHWPALFFLAGLTKLSTVPIELLKSAMKTVNVATDARLSYCLYGQTFCDSRSCNPSFFQILFETHSHELTTAVFAGEKVVAIIMTPLDAFVTAWCLIHSDPTSSWTFFLVHSLSPMHFQKQLRGSDCLSQGHQHGRIVGLHVGRKDTSKILPDLLKLHPCTQQVEHLTLYGSSGLEVDDFATHLSTLYPYLKHLQVRAPQWLSPVLCRLHELTSLTSVTLENVSSEFSLPLQQCPSLKSLLLDAYIPSLVLPNMNTLEILILNGPLTSAGVRGMCKALCQTTSLKHIVLDNTKLSPSGAMALAAALTLNKTLYEVIVRDETIGNEGVRVLQEVLNNHSTVKQSVVQSNKPRFLR